MWRERIRNLRRDKGWTQQYMADLLHINRRTYSAYENGFNAPPIEVLIALAIIYNTSVDYLAGITDQFEPHHRIK